MIGGGLPVGAFGGRKDIMSKVAPVCPVYQAGTLSGNPLAGWMAKSGFRDGCPIATTLLESAPQSEGIARAGREAFAAWCRVFERTLLRDGFSRANALQLSRLTVSSIEGALIVARAESRSVPIKDVAKSLSTVLRNCSPPRKRT